jgi:cytochrome c553
VTKDGTRAVASDPDRDAIYVVDLGVQKLTQTIALKAGDEPGRLIEDGAGRVHVALRSGGALVTIDPTSGSIVARRDVCPAPRGVAWDSSTDLVWVACATGELVALPAAGGASTRQITVERDLRDVVVTNGSLSVTKFRTAEVLRIASDGSVSRRDQLPSPVSTFSPHVAWRVIGAPSGAVVAVHQAETTQSLSTTVQGGYGGGGCGGLSILPSSPGTPAGGPGSLMPADDGGLGLLGPPGSVVEDAGPELEDATPAFDAATSQNCFAGGAGVGVAGGPTGPGAGGGLPMGSGCGPESGAVMSILTVLTADGTVTVNTSFAGVLPVDVAVSSDGSLVAAVAPGNAFAPLSTVFEFSSCGSPVSGSTGLLTLQQPIAVAFDSKNDLVVQTREPAQLSILSSGGATTIPLSTITRADTGYDVFHTQAGGMIACASCHPEGRDDGFVWTLNGDRRRTPSLRGTIAGTAPYHWPGDEPNLNVLVNDVYTVRMSGASLNTDQMSAIASWVQHVSPPPAPSWVDAASAQRGKALFESASTGCATCHSGAKFTNNLTMDVGTGGNFQVPPLVGVGWSTPLMHDGCASTLADRFGACATPQHGSTGALSQQNVSDLIAYLETL